MDDREDGEEYFVYRTDGAGGRVEWLDVTKTEELHKRKKMDFSLTGRPTQFHAVPVEERAVDRNGKKLPYALEWPEGHPKARGQRRHVEEKGPFGKSLRRKGSSRATRTTTPAKKENPALDGFEQAWRHDQKRAAEAKQQSITSGSQGDGKSTHRPPSLHKEPTQVMLYGFSASSPADAIKFYETVSGGIICEDYDREPPPKIPNTFSPSASYPPRALTPAETQFAKQYRGGEHWIKVTFDSAEAAERAIEASPHIIGGHYVYAQAFRGVEPDVDEPLLQPRADVQHRSLGMSSRPSQTIGPSFVQRAHLGSRNATTLPRSFTTGAISQSPEHDANEIASPSSSTASSATATGLNYPNLRNRHHPQTEENRSSTNPQQETQATPHPQSHTHFPDMPRMAMRPASEAFLPHPTWSESLIQRLVNAGWFPGDFIGDGAPTLDNGDFDHANASFYWRFMNWIDSVFGTDLCGLKD